MAVRLVLQWEKGKVTVEECLEKRICRVLEARGYLSGRILDPLEAAFMVSRCVAEVATKGCGWFEALSVVEEAGLPLAMFFVYYDLRKRGRIVRRGIRRGTLIVDTGGSRPLEVRVLRGGSPISIGDLIEWSRIAAGDGKEPVIAVVDGHGDVTYYTARAVRSFR